MDELKNNDIKQLTLVFASHNNNKAKEIQLLMPESIKILTLQDIGFDDDIPETATTLEGNALLKARTIFEKFNTNCFADDTGLEVTVLNGAPGVHSARYAGSSKNAEENLNLLLKNLDGFENREAQFRTVICVIINGEELFFEGCVKGTIRKQKSGKEGFGYDPIFEPSGSTKTFAEMSLKEKNGMSHRAIAFKKMVQHFLL